MLFINSLALLLLFTINFIMFSFINWALITASHCHYSLSLFHALRLVLIMSIFTSFSLLSVIFVRLFFRKVCWFGLATPFACLFTLFCLLPDPYLPFYYFTMMFFAMIILSPCRLFRCRLPDAANIFADDHYFHFDTRWRRHITFIVLLDICDYMSSPPCLMMPPRRLRCLFAYFIFIFTTHHVYSYFIVIFSLIIGSVTYCLVFISLLVHGFIAILFFILTLG